MSGKRAIIGGVERFKNLNLPNTVQCDIEGCGAETYADRYRGPGARAEAASRGWGYVDGQDLCPEHLKDSAP